jgi:hypothetical protein
VRALGGAAAERNVLAGFIVTAVYAALSLAAAAGLLGGLVALATLVWYVVLVVIGGSLARRIGYCVACEI